MNIQQILNNLRAGAKLRLKFESPAARERFRVAIYKKKRDEDKALTDVLDEDRKVLRYEPTDEQVILDKMKLSEESCENVFVATLWLEDKPEEQDFVVEILPQSEGTSGDDPSE